MKQAEIIAIGNELTIGRTVDTNSNWLAKQLMGLGLAVRRITCVPDEAPVILTTLEQALQHSNPIIVTGGLGPTKDDLTKKTIADFLGLPLQEDPAVRTRLEAWYARRGRVVNSNTLTQALVPVGAQVLNNPVGSAPGLHFVAKGTNLFSLPGVPHEMKAIFEESIRPLLQAHYALDYLRQHTLRTVALPESEMALRIEDIEDNLPPQLAIAYNAMLHMVDLRLTARGPRAHTAALNEAFDHTLAALRARVQNFVYGENEDTLEAALGRALLGKQRTIAFAESCTGGALAARMISVAGASRYVRGGIVAYDNTVKTQQLGVPPSLLQEHGAVSEPVARAMAEGARKALQADVALSTTGIAGPDGGSDAKPVGTVWIGYADAQGSQAHTFLLEQDRARNIERTVILAMDVLRRKL
jgi:nicotinamide-nucleotide amidase